MTTLPPRNADESMQDYRRRIIRVTRGKALDDVERQVADGKVAHAIMTLVAILRADMDTGG